MANRWGWVGLAVCVWAALTGCRVEHKGSDGQSDDVKIATPFGGMSVKTDEKVVEGSTGLTPYPGALMIKKSKDSGAADVNMTFGSFHLGVKAISYHTDDPPDKVISFYRKDMAHFGPVILCRGDAAVGQPTRTPDGLTCDRSHGSHVEVDEERADQELRAGSKQHQHIVAVNRDGTGSKIGLIMLDLPGKLGGGRDDRD